MKYYQQGDVILIKNACIKGEVQKTLVVQEGEHSGHAHRFSRPTTQLYLDGTQKYVRLAESDVIEHEEHFPLEIERGDYEVRIVRQKDIFTKVIAPVID